MVLLERPDSLEHDLPVDRLPFRREIVGIHESMIIICTIGAFWQIRFETFAHVRH
jgi:hypothetical protein